MTCAGHCLSSGVFGVYVTGSPTAETLHQNLPQIQASDILDRLGLEPYRYILLSAHREESIFFASVGHPFPVVCIRTSTERLEALDKACFNLAGIDERSLLR